MPPGVYQDRYGYFIKTPYKRIGRPDTTRSEIWANYEAVTRETGEQGTLRWLVNKYLESERFKALAKKTRDEAEKALNRIQDTKTKRGTFGDARLDQITPGVIRKYLDNRKAKIAGNREVGYLSTAFSWALERDMVKVNPCKGVRRNPEKPRELYVTDAMYQTAIDKAPEWIRYFMEIAYLTAARKVEVLDLRRSDMLPQGLQIRRRKGSKTNVVKWSPRLRAAVESALAMPSEISTMYIIHNRKGQPFTTSGLDTAWQRMEVDFTPHDLKKKGVSDSTAENPAGHKSLSMIGRYRVKPDEVEPPR